LRNVFNNGLITIGQRWTNVGLFNFKAIDAYRAKLFLPENELQIYVTVC